MAEYSDVEFQEFLLIHAVLPRLLPECKPTYSQQLKLMNKMVENIESVAQYIPRQTLQLFQKMRKIHSDGTSIGCTNIRTEIANLLPGDTFAMFVRYQNCTLMVHLLNNSDEYNAVVATFPGDLLLSEIYQHESDIEFHYPQQAIKVKWNGILQSSEFAEQLSILHETTPCRNKKRNYVTKWLLALLADEDSSTASKSEFPIISKKVRAEIIGEMKTDYFRRSRVFMTMKVLLQHNLTIHLGPKMGRFLYKIIHLKFLDSICQRYTERNCERFNIDLLAQTIAKIARRIDKLDSIPKPDSMTNDIGRFFNEIISSSKQTIHKIRSNIDKEIRAIHNKERARAELSDLKGLNIGKALKIKMRKYYETQMSSQRNNEEDTEMSSAYIIKSYRRFFTRYFPCVDRFNCVKTDLEWRIFWTEFEVSILYNMDEESLRPDEIHEWLSLYCKYTENKYKDNQLLISRMLLVRLKLIAILDRIVTKMYPLLLEHDSGINPNLIGSLLLPQRIDMEIAHKLENYFSERNAEADDPSLIGEKDVKKRSFAPKFATNDSKMIEIWKNLKNMDRLNIEEKRKEYRMMCEESEKLKAEYQCLICVNITNKNYLCSSSNCERCMKENEQKTKELYEYVRILPNEKHEQLAIVFELQIPKEIAYLRDILFSFIKFCAGNCENLDIKSTWKNCIEFEEFVQTGSECVTLGSTIQNTSHASKIHIDNPFEMFIVENKSNCIYYGEISAAPNQVKTRKAMPATLSDNAIKHLCTFKAQDEYTCLQWTMNGTSHYQNQVLTRHFECPQCLSVSEYKNFGSLRADGHRLQLRKLHAMIANESLSFEKESVLSLIMQSLWECGVAGDSGAIRESHFDLAVPDFCSAMIKIVQQFIEEQKNNWVYPFKLLMATLVAVRIFEINDNDDVAETIVNLLHSIRETVLNWIVLIGTAIRDLSPPNDENERELRLRLIYVAITGGLTFFVHPKHKHFEKIFNEINGNELTAPRIWLQFVITLKNNVRMYTNDEDRLTPNVRMFLRLIEMIGICIESKIREKIQKNYHSIDQLVQMQWPRSDYGMFETYDFHTDYPHIFMINVRIESVLQTVTIDIITGSFLVDGLPLSRLPTEIVQSEIYQWFFGDVAFEVQPDAQKNFSTVQKYNGCTYHFKQCNQNDNQTITIIERNSDGVEKELLDHSLLKEDLPHLLVNNYCHWLNEDNCLEFRPRMFGQKHFSSETDIEYLLNLDTHRLQQVKTERHMIDIHSKTFHKITKQLNRLEKSKYIHVFVDDKTKEAHIELVRMNLKFIIDNYTRRTKHHLISKEFNDMRISKYQNIGTLYGLNHGLVLENINDEKVRIILMPNGIIQVERNRLHVSVNIEIRKNVGKPPFFQYQVDEFCKQLKAINSSHASWFYLAHLHAITSHNEIEKFTGMSGTERALQILQSAFAWSSSPYEPEAIEQLLEIAKLSPIRKLCEKSQIVNWPKDISPRSAQDSFVFIAKKLFEDSQRLHGLHFKENAQSFNIKTDLILNERGYHRNIQLQPNLRVDDSFIKYKELKPIVPQISPITFSPNTQTISILYHRNGFKVKGKPDLWSFLTANRRTRLDGMSNTETILDFHCHKITDSFADLWICLYEVARKHHFEIKMSDIQLAMVLSLLAHLQEEIDPILVLQAVAQNPQAFEHIEPPLVQSYRLQEGFYNNDKVVHLLKQYRIKPANYGDLNEQKQRAHDTTFTTVLDDLTAIVSNAWNHSNESVDFGNKWANQIQIERANSAVNQKYTFWLNNLKLTRFIKKVEQKLHTIKNLNSVIKLPDLPPFTEKVQNQLDVKHNIDIDQLIKERLRTFDDEICEAEQEWKMGKRAHRDANYWWNILEEVSNSDETQHLIDAGLYPRIVPSLYLPKLIAPNTDAGLKKLIGVWALNIARDQRNKRIEFFAKRSELRTELEIERKNEPHVNWKPYEKPEWLIFEIERNLTIRRIQIEIAKRMISPPATEPKHSLMQLNMGEGKTDVIVPILAAVLANGKQVCQITVLKPLFARNLKSLRQYLGGMLNQRIYMFPCRRDMAISNHIEQIMDIYEECKTNRGVVLSLPDYRLSFELKLYESIQKDDLDSAESILSIQQWINANVRNILDESDAILQANYQLIYTVGNQLPLDGGSQRWFVAQAVFKRVPYHMKRLYERYGNENIEFDDKYVENGHVYGSPYVKYRPDVFTPCRILNESIFDELKSALVDDFLDGRMDISFPEIVRRAKDELRQAIAEKEPSRRSFEIIERFAANERDTIWILSGLLRFEVLKLTLTKRWRVHYGVDEKSPRQMAIPFKAKDIAAELTEFGHPDVAICFTQMSYYYSGLTDAQLRKIFNTLENKQNGGNIYEKWIEKIPNELVSPTIRKYSGVNMDDPKQRDQLLFPLLRFNMHVIDFWLANSVFPHEAKVFERKLMCSAWDLCSDQLKHCVTGFSGTNDTKNTLPMAIAQKDLPELQTTNDEMRNVLLRQKKTYKKDDSLPANMSGKQILEILTKQEIPVLLDSGALMLELTNVQVAVEWLKITSVDLFDAAVYFDSADMLQTIDRNGNVTEFDSSVYRDNLNRCLVYLDDVHTRGTDLKFPSILTACVTLSGDITRDKTVQSCMRMRQLKKGHSIWFLPSYEAEVRIRNICQLHENDCISSQHVIKFIEANSKKMERENMVHWAAAALNYTKKICGHETMKNSNQPNKLQVLYNTCVDDEFVKLDQMYGDKEEADLTEMTFKKFDKLAYEHKKNRKFIREMQEGVENKLTEYAQGVKRFSRALNDEQQKELEQEQELEEERHQERPNVRPAVPVFDKQIQELIEFGVTDEKLSKMKEERALFSFVDSLSNTKLINEFKNNEDAWSGHLLVTKDFIKVTDSSSQTCDDFLRPVWWISRITNTTGIDIFLLLSSFECNRLMPTFRTTKYATLHMFRPRLSKHHCSLLNDKNMQVTGANERMSISVEDEIQIGMYAGMMYFKCDDEQNAYCNFMGLIPRPRPSQLDSAFENGIIEPKGYVPFGNRNLVAVAEYVNKCNFKKNPINLAIKLIESHHQTLLKESHVASILNRGFKTMFIKQENH